MSAAIAVPMAFAAVAEESNPVAEMGDAERGALEEIAHRLLDLTLARYEHRIQRQKKKFAARILSGKSKFATEVVLPEGKCSFRHTAWFAPPDKLELNPEWHETGFETESESGKIWLDSFLKIPPVKNPPLARLIKPDGSSALFYDDKKN